MFSQQAICSVMIMFVIQWIYALMNILVALVLYLYIGKTSPGLPTGMLSNTECTVGCKMMTFSGITSFPLRFVFTHALFPTFLASPSKSR